MIKLIKVLFILLLVVVAAAFAAPFFFKDKIVASIKTAINKNLTAKVGFKDVDISFLRRFPRVAVAITDLQVIGSGEFSNDTLLAVKNTDIALNIMSVIRGSDMKIYSVALDTPRIHAIVSKSGKANWDITKKDSASVTAPGESKPFKLELEQYAIHKGYLNYVDEKSNLKGEIINLNHQGSGDFTSDLFTLKTTTTADAVSFTSGTIPYLIDTKTAIDADVQVDNRTNKYQFKTDNIQVNNLKLAAQGFFQLINDSTYNMDISFNAPSTEFKNILSLIPVIYKHDFEKVNASGTAVFNGMVKGTYSASKIPAYTVNLDVKNGVFKYSDLPQPVNDINLTMNVTNPDGEADHSVVNITQGHFAMNNEPFDFRLLMKNPVSNMFIDAAAKGKLDLSKITQFIKLANDTKLGGTLLADVSAKGTVAAMEQQKYDQFIAKGTIAVNSLLYSSKEYPDGIKVNNLFMTFNPRNITISDLDGQYKQTNFSGSGSVSNLIPYLLKDKTLGGNLSVTADHMNLNDWIGTSPDTATKKTPAGAPFAVPANLNMAINASVGRLLYDKVDIQHLTGNIVLKDETVFLTAVKGAALDGTMSINGTYSTKESKKKPDISLNYDVKELDVQKTFNAFMTVQKLMPVGQYLSGKLSSQLKMTGKLGDNMMPDFSSLTGEGNVLLIEGFLQKFAPLEKLADLLNVKELQQITMKDVKNYFEFTNGKVLVKPFTLKVKDIEMEIGGMQGLDQTLDYLINLKLPRSYMGDKGNALLNNLVTQVNNKGIPLTLGETVNLHVKMGGTIKNPVFKTDLKEAAGNTADQLREQALAFALSKINNSKKAVSDTVLSVKDQLQKNVQDELRRRMYGSKDTLKVGSPDEQRKKLEEAGRGILNNLFKQKPRDSTRN